MTENEWRACTDPVAMLRFVQGRASARKLRLFLCACARVVWEEMPTGLLREAVDVGERYADGLADEAERERLRNHVYDPFMDGPRLDDAYAPTARRTLVHFLAFTPVLSPTRLDQLLTVVTWRYSSELTAAAQPAFLRDIFGPLPFRPSPSP